MPYPLAQVTGEDEVAGERVGEGTVKLQNFEQSFPLDDVEVTVGKRSNICTRMCKSRFFPKDISEHVTFS